MTFVQLICKREELSSPSLLNVTFASIPTKNWSHFEFIPNCNKDLPHIWFFIFVLFLKFNNSKFTFGHPATVLHFKFKSVFVNFKLKLEGNCTYQSYIGRRHCSRRLGQNLVGCQSNHCGSCSNKFCICRQWISRRSVNKSVCVRSTVPIAKKVQWT